MSLIQDIEAAAAKSNEDWTRTVQPVVDLLASLLPNGAQILAHPSVEALHVRWSQGPAPSWVVAEVSALLGRAPRRRDMREGDVSWSAFTLCITHTTLPSAYGLAFLLSSLAVPCFVCMDRRDTAQTQAYYDLLDSPFSLDSSHPYLDSLTALGADVPQLLRMAELLPVLAESTEFGTMATSFHDLEHLPGLAALESALSAEAPRA